jgi:hypothetical protein
VALQSALDIHRDVVAEDFLFRERPDRIGPDEFALNIVEQGALANVASQASMS